MSAPSSSLLRFLRVQSGEICFFTSNRKAVSCQSPRFRGPKASSRSLAHQLPAATRHLTTSPRGQATVESSILNLDFLRQAPKPNTPSRSTFPDAIRPVSSTPLADNASACRRKSTDSRTLLERIWNQKGKKEGPELKPTDLNPLPSFLDDVGGTSLGRSKAGKGANELKLRCTEFDENGRATLTDGEFKKSELIAKVLILGPSVNDS